MICELANYFCAHFGAQIIIKYKRPWPLCKLDRPLNNLATLYATEILPYLQQQRHIIAVTEARH